jgi:hypothetical protein
MRAHALAIAVAAALLAAPAAAAQEGSCTGSYLSDGIPIKPGPRLRFGTTPSGAAGQLGPIPSDFERDRPDRILAALAQLRPPRAPFVTHAYTSWEDAGPREEKKLLTLAKRYTGAGYQFELVVRYKPDAEDEGDVAGFAAFVKRMVRLLGGNRGVVAFQITNEVNFTVSPDSSDGAFEGAKDALIQGVIAAKAEARRLGYDQLEIGFNWLYRTDTSSERSFWDYLRDHGGRPFVSSLDWVGLDAYPGTFFPPSTAPGTERNFIVNALSLLRCYSQSAGIPASVPIHVQENGFPTGAGRTYERQAQTLEAMVRAFHDFRGTYNVADYRWFNLRDAQTSSPNFQQHYGLMEDDYTPKPAFGAYRRLIAELSIRAGAAVPPATAQVSLKVRHRGRCARRRVSARLGGAGARQVRRADFRIPGRRAKRDARAPFRRKFRVPRSRRAKLRRVRVAALLSDGRAVRISRPFRACGRRYPYFR